MKKTKSFDFDKFIIGMAVCYTVVPIVIFLLGWTKLYIALPCVLMLSFLGYKVFLSVIAREKIQACEISIYKNRNFWLLSFGIIFLWTLFSGIGGFGYQTGDFVFRNPMYRDLYINDWPVVFDLSREPEYVLPFLNGADTAMYVYYFTWWLPAAGITRIFGSICKSTGMVELFADLILFAWAFIGLCLVFYCLVRVLNKYSYWIVAALVLFGGLDFVIYLVSNMSLPVNEHIEYWAQYYQYVSNSNQIYWAFNQSIPVWLVLTVFLLLGDNSCKAGWGALMMAFGPMPTLGMIPIVVADVFRKGDDAIQEKRSVSIFKSLGQGVKSLITLPNIFGCIVILVSFVPFYSLVASEAGGDIPVFDLFRSITTMGYYVTFLLIEFLIYYIVMGNAAKKYSFYYVVLAELLILPFFTYGRHNDLSMRASIPALFILMIICLRFIFDTEKINIRRKIMVVMLIIGFCTGGTEIQRNMSLTFSTTQPNLKQEDFYSFGEISLNESWIIEMVVDQQMSMDRVYKNSVFGKYIMR